MDRASESRREIKFRAWYVDKKKVLDCKKDMTPTFLGYLLTDRILPGKMELMQYTGLKDSEGTEIYEGDILKHGRYCNFHVSEKKYISQVKWGETGDSDGYSYGKHYEYMMAEEGSSLADIHETSVVIGNIYENPELIKEEL